MFVSTPLLLFHIIQFSFGSHWEDLHDLSLIMLGVFLCLSVNHIVCLAEW